MNHMLQALLPLISLRGTLLIAKVLHYGLCFKLTHVKGDEHKLTSLTATKHCLQISVSLGKCI